MKRHLSTSAVASKPPRKRQEMMRTEDYKTIQEQEEQIKKLQSSIRSTLKNSVAGKVGMNSAIAHYAKASCSQLCNAIQALPRELRDMIYAPLTEVRGMVPAAGQCSHHGFIDNGTMFAEYHFLNSDYVGKVTVKEVAEVFYKVNNFAVGNCFLLKSFLDDKSLHGAVAKDFVRSMEVEIPNRALVSKDHHGEVDSCTGHKAELKDHTVKALQDALRELLTIKHRKGFELELVLSDKVDTGDWDEDRVKSIMMALRPVYAELVDEGFDVCVTLAEAEDMFHEDDLTEYLRSDPEDWDEMLSEFRSEFQMNPFDYSDEDEDYLMGFPALGMFGPGDMMGYGYETDETDDEDDDDDDDIPGLL